MNPEAEVSNARMKQPRYGESEWGEKELGELKTHTDSRADTAGNQFNEGKRQIQDIFHYTHGKV